MQPLEKFLKTSVGQDCFHRIERVPKLVVTPGLVNEILTGMAGGHGIGSAFAARHDMVPSRGHRPVTKCANDHKSELRMQNAEPKRKVSSGFCIAFLIMHSAFYIGRNPRLVSSTSSPPQKQCRVLSAKCRVVYLILHSSLFILNFYAGRSIYFAFRGSKWYARPVTLRVQALI
jgi:hypothetical protein